MKKTLLIAALFSLSGAPCLAGDKITVAQAVPLSTALRNLDGHMIVIKQNGADATVISPWDFGSGSLRMRIANNIAVIDAALKTSEDARAAILKEQIRKFEARTGEKANELRPGSPEFDEYQRQYNEMVAGPAPGTQDLARIKASDLKLDKNDIPVTVLSAMKPILDDDVSGK